MQIKTIIQYHFTPVRMAHIPKSRYSVCIFVVRKETPYILGGNYYWVSLYKDLAI